MSFRSMTREFKSLGFLCTTGVSCFKEMAHSKLELPTSADRRTERTHSVNGGRIAEEHGQSVYADRYAAALRETTCFQIVQEAFVKSAVVGFP